MGGDENHISVGFRYAGGNGADARAGDKLHTNPRLRVDLLQVVDQLGKIFDGVDIVMRWRRDEHHAFGRMAKGGNLGGNLKAGELPAFAGLRALCHFNFDLAALIQVFRSNTEASRCDLFDG